MTKDMKDYFWAVFENRLREETMNRCLKRNSNPSGSDFECDMIDVTHDVINKWFDDLKV